jgi:hypothetical protein
MHGVLHDQTSDGQSEHGVSINYPGVRRGYYDQAGAIPMYPIRTIFPRQPRSRKANSELLSEYYSTVKLEGGYK